MVLLKRFQNVGVFSLLSPLVGVIEGFRFGVLYI